MTQQPSDERKLALVREKTQELQALTAIKERSDQLVQYFEELAKNMRALSQGAQGTYNVKMYVFDILTELPSTRRSRHGH